VILSAQKLTKQYGAALESRAVSAADIAVIPGEFITIIGRSGSGKSTLLAMIGALTKPNSGEVKLDGKDIWSISELERSIFRATQIGFVFQFPSLLSNLRAVDNVALPAMLAGTMSVDAAYARALELLDSVGLSDRTKSYPGQLSGGEQRRVVIARALINSPRFLLADEPTSDLDEDTEADIIELLGVVKVDDEMRSRAPHPVPHHEMVVTLFNNSTKRSNRVLLSGGTWSPQALDRLKEGVLAHEPSSST